MSRARQVGRWVRQVLQSRLSWPKTLTLGVLAFIVLVMTTSILNPPRTSDQTFVARVVSRPAAEVEAERARQEARRKAEADRLLQAERVQEAARRRELERELSERIRDHTNRAIKKCVAVVRERTNARLY